MRAAQRHSLRLVHRERPRESQRKLEARHSARRSFADEVVDRSDLNDGAGVPADDDAGAAAGRAGIAVLANVRLDHATRAVYEAIAVHVAEEEDLRADLEAQGEFHFLLRMVAQALDALLFREPQVPIAAVSSGVRVGALEREDEWEGERATPAHGEEEDDVQY